MVINVIICIVNVLYPFALGAAFHASAYLYLFYSVTPSSLSPSLSLSILLASFPGRSRVYWNVASKCHYQY